MVAVLGLGILLGATRQAPAQPASSQAPGAPVWVAVTAMDREGRLVLDLGPGDFEIFEAGVAQPITEFRSHAMPFALSIMFDRSGSLGSSLGPMRQALSALIDGFRPGDRANVGWFDTLPSVSPRFSSHRETLMRSISAATGAVSLPCPGPWMTRFRRNRVRGASGIWDAAACGIQTVASDAETPRRVVLLITDGVDNASITEQPEVQVLADTFSVMVYVVAIRGLEGLNATALRTLATETGGGFFSVQQGEDLTPVMSRIGDELRHQYAIGYAPAGPERRGRLEVRVKRPDVTARARRATMTVLPVAAAVTQAVSAERARAAAPMVAADTVFDRSARNALLPWDLPVGPLPDLEAEANRIRTAGLRWVSAGGPVREPVRRIQLATFVLDFLSTQDAVPYWRRGGPAAELYEWTSSQTRASSPHPAERTWHLAGMTLLQRFGAVETLRYEVLFARARFPDEPRFQLVEAFAAEMPIWPHDRDRDRLIPSQNELWLMLDRYGVTFGIAPIQQEGRIRFGFFELLRGRHAEALKHFDLAGEPDDEMLGYLLHLFRGRAFIAARRPAEAIVSFQRALDAMPHAQSATLALAAALVTQGRQNEAEALVSRMLALPEAPFDPWTIYTFPEARFWPQRMEELRRVGGS